MLFVSIHTAAIRDNFPSKT